MNTIPLNPLDQLKVVNDLMGSPYKINGRNKREGFDCLSLTKELQFRAFGRTLPDIYIQEDTLAGFIKAAVEGETLYDWQQVEKPVHGCVVELSRGKVPHHCGTYFHLPEHGVVGLVHCLKGAGVIYDPWITLKAAGWRRFVYNVPRNA